MDVRPSPIAGRWYPADPARLTQTLDRYLASAHVHPPASQIWGIVVPHAGLRYAGPTAAWAHACLRGVRPEIVAVIGPLHDPALDPVLTSAHTAYATPLGLVAVDQAAVAELDRALRRQHGAGLVAVQNDQEHAIEMALPFLQRVLGPFQLLPVMLHTQSAHIAEILGHALAEILHGRAALLVASSDLSHYYPPALARTFDMELLRRLAAFDPQGVLAAETEGVGFACGSAAIAAVLWASHDLGAGQVSILRYATSGDVARDMTWVVGYGAAVIW
jgi:AmmeMemoRadiSam system protein B